MNLDIFESTKNWSETADDQLAYARLARLVDEARNAVPKGFYDKKAPLMFEDMRKSDLYKQLKTLPKGGMHNIFLDCGEDKDFYRKYIVNDPNVYVTEDWVSFRIGTKEQAKLLNWISMKDARAMYKTQDDFIDAISSITLFNTKELSEVIHDHSKVWQIFTVKLKNTKILIYALHLFKKYLKHLFLKLIANGYSRVQFRAELVKLYQYDENGKLLGRLDTKSYCQTVDEVYEEVRQQYNHFTIGFIFCGYKNKTEQQNETIFTQVCELNWDKTIGFDFVQEEDLYQSMSKYNQIVDRVMLKYPHLRYKKVYHAGETNNHLSHNIDMAVEAGSVRIGHGLNILQRIEFLPYCKFICFEKCPISNLMLGFTGDPRESSAPILLGLGYALSLNPGDAIKFGAEDATADYFVSAISYSWTLKHFKLVAIHSINHAICKQHVRKEMLIHFEKTWNNWISNFLRGKHIENKKKQKIIDIFTVTNNWHFSELDEKANLQFERLRHEEISRLPSNFYRIYTLTHLDHIRSSRLFEVLKTIPKGVLHHDHFDCNEDEDFYRLHVMTDPNVYLSANKTKFQIGTVKEAQQNGWITFDKLREEFKNQRQLVKFVSNLTMLSREQLSRVSCQQKDFWDLFEVKISNFFIILEALHIFKKYVLHVLRKYVKNGYNRIEFRALLINLKEYDQNGTLTKIHDKKIFMTAFDEVYDKFRKQHSDFSAGFIFFGLKEWSEEQNFNTLDEVLSHEWKNTIGIDFVQQEDSHGSMEPYIRVGDRILKKYAHLNIKKVYHAGETKDHLNQNVELAVRSGAVRIGHGLNIVKRIEYLPNCKHICFELNPISNLLTGGMNDIRMSTAPLLLGLGYAVSISSDDPGKFGYEDTTVDYYASAVSFNWQLKHLKLIAYHSINHAIVNEGERLAILESFNNKWDQWVLNFLDRYERAQQIQYPKRKRGNNHEDNEDGVKKRFHEIDE